MQARPKLKVPPYTDTYVDEGRLDDVPPTPTSPALPQHQQHDRQTDNLSADLYGGRTPVASMSPPHNAIAIITHH
jgi:hypothetical protein